MKRYEFKKPTVVSKPETTGETEIVDERIKLEVLTKEIIKKYTLTPKIIPVLSLPLQYNAKKGVFEIIPTPSLITARGQGYFYGATLPSEVNAGYYDLAVDKNHAAYMHLLAEDVGLAKDATVSGIKSQIDKLQFDSNNLLRTKIAGSEIQIPIGLQSVLPKKAELYGADETVAQSISLDVGGFKLVEVYCVADAATTFTVQFSWDNTHWFTYYTSPAAETKYSDVFWTAAQYIKVSSAAAGAAGNKVSLVIGAKP